jgi:hypothetical protein
MAFYTICDQGNGVGSLQKDLNASLQVFTGVAEIVGCGLAYDGNDNRAGIMLEAAGNQGYVSTQEAYAWVNSAGSLDDLASSLKIALGSMGTVCSLSLTYGAKQWRALVVYLGEKSGEAYAVYQDSNSSESALESNMNTNVGNANGVVAFSYTYADNVYAALAVYY